MATAMGAPRMAMKKVLCNGCGLMNLEKFVTFPHCAACGALLREAVPHPFLQFWRKPLGTPLWAAVVGVCGAGLGIFGIAVVRETRRVDEKSLVVYAQVPRRFTSTQNAQVSFALDTTEASNSSTMPEWSDVRLRLSRTTLQNFAFVRVTPAYYVETQGSGKYLIFKRLARDEQISLLLRPRRAGTARLELTFYVRDFAPFPWRSSIQTAAKQPVKAP
ncbi:MAG TPA: hypothetical protein VGB45_05975 [Abditibacterium sp.]|jgi:hypothetical protein